MELKELIESINNGDLYNCMNDELIAEQAKCLELQYEYNHTRPSEGAKRKALLKEMLAECGEGCYIEPPLHANWGGHNLHFGNHVYANFNLTVVDDTHVYVGNDVLFAPNVILATAGHPIDPELRKNDYQFNMPIRIGNNVWLGAGVIVLSFLVKALAGFLIYGIIAAGAALVMLILESAIVGARRKKAKAAKKAAEAEVVEEAPVEEAVEEAVVEEPVVEAAPVEEAVAEEPAVEEAPAESDAYGSEFDAFIATLTAEERTQFTQIFLLRSENKLPEIPEYKIGGDNKVFFRKIFVNLGSLRARIPDGLMEKIYQFTIRQ